jgi:hypothetical protein
MARLPYREGTWFAFPLKNGGYGVGLVARSPKNGRVLFGYFFGPRREKIPGLDEVASLEPSAAVARLIFGDLGLINGEWKILGHSEAWDRNRWPMPHFAKVTDLAGYHVASKRQYSDNNPAELIGEWRVTDEEIRGLPEDIMHGHRAVEAVLTRIIGP